MSTALYRRYRPDNFEHVIGQDHVTVPLRAALAANKVTHAYLFSGPRGCGKTTSARILARCLNCAQGPTATPCGTCDSCRELATGGPGSLDVVEIDAASHGGVDDARELRERATFAPVRDRYKIFIIDEAHMVTQAGFNALLKLVEEPPEHVKFVFATTEPDKVLGTIRSRTHHYPFRLVPPEVLEPYLAQLAAGEAVDIAPGVLNLVIRAGGGSVRDTLSVLDQLMAGTVDGHLPYAQAVALLGYTDVALLDESVDALAGGDGAAVFRVIERMVDSGHDPRRFVEDLLQRLRDLLIISVAGDSAVDVLTGVPADQLDRMTTQARNWGPRALSYAADLTDQALRSMVGATSPRLQLELLIGRILVPAQAITSSEAVQGGVGLLGGGAPHERVVAQGAGFAAGAQAVSSVRGEPTGAQIAHKAAFGAAQAKERLRAAKAQSTQAEQTASSASSAPEVSEDTSTHQQVKVAPSADAWNVPSVPVSGEPEADLPRMGSQSSGHNPPADQSHWQETTVASAENSAVSSGNMPTLTRNSAAQSDMLRQRWPEVVQRLSEISRVAWAMLNGNGQLGAVNDQDAIILLPTQGMVDTFMQRQRGSAVEQAIYQATGLHLRVRAQVGQAQGGAPVTTPSAPAAHTDLPSPPQTVEPTWPTPTPVPNEAPLPASDPAPQKPTSWPNQTPDIHWPTQPPQSEHTWPTAKEKPRLQVVDGPPTTDTSNENNHTWEHSAEPATPIEETHIAPEDDDTASLDDDNIDMDINVGLSAVQDILGGKVIEERVEESKG